MLRTGDEAAVAVPVATLWSAPDAVRPADAAALSAPPDIPGWIAAMTPDEQGTSAVVTQLLLGERVLVEQARPDGWVRVVALEQPARARDPRGYPGWLRAAHLGAAAAGDRAEPLVVDAGGTVLRHRPGGAVAVPDVMLGTLLTPAGAADAGWLPVRVPGHAAALWAPPGALRPVPVHPPTGDEAVATARRLLGAVYVWGGLSTFGIDCSGLVHLVWRRLGVRLPRDAHEQATATTPVPFGAERPGDLYFFARPGRPVHHVGIVTAADGDRRMVHASFAEHRVVEEPLPPDRSATLVAVHRVPILGACRRGTGTR